MAQATGQRRVVIVGGGFAGLFAARALRRAPVQVTLIDRPSITCSSRCCTSARPASCPKERSPYHCASCSNGTTTSGS